MRIDLPNVRLSGRLKWSTHGRNGAFDPAGRAEEFKGICCAPVRFAFFGSGLSKRSAVKGSPMPSLSILGDVARDVKEQWYVTADLSGSATPSMKLRATVAQLVIIYQIVRCMSNDNAPRMIRNDTEWSAECCPGRDSSVVGAPSEIATLREFLQRLRNDWSTLG